MPRAYYTPPSSYKHDALFPGGASQNLLHQPMLKCTIQTCIKTLAPSLAFHFTFFNVVETDVKTNVADRKVRFFGHIVRKTALEKTDTGEGGRQAAEGQTCKELVPRCIQTGVWSGKMAWTNQSPADSATWLERDRWEWWAAFTFTL